MSWYPDIGDGLRFVAAGILGACLCSPLRAGPVSVSGAASHSGSQGLRVQIDPGACSASQNEQRVSGEVISADRGACELISANNTTIASPATVNFSAGYRVSMGAGFRVEQGAEFSVSLDPSRVRGGFVRDDTPADEPHYAARFFLNADNLTLTTDERLVLFDAEDATGRSWLSLVMTYDGGTNTRQLRVAAPDGTSTAETTPVDLPAGWQGVEVEWRASDPGEADGRVWVTLGNTAQPGLTGLDNENGRVDLVRWGVLRALSSTDGHLDLDDFVSRRAGRIGLP